jgi:hypothetical protein
MSNIRTAFSLVIFSFLILSCGGEDMSQNLEEFTGTYDCLKFSGMPLDSTFAVQQDLVVAVDPDNGSNLLISTLSIPVDENGAFGPAALSSSMGIELFFEGDEIFFRMSPILENGIALPCTFTGTKKE